MVPVRMHGINGLMTLLNTVNNTTKFDSLILCEGIIFKKQKKIMSKHIFVLYLLMCCASSLSAQSTHVIELAIIEVRYNVVHGTDKDQYAYRCGRNVSQYFSVNNLRDDSLRASPDPAISSIVLDEMLAEALNRNDPSKRRPTSPGRGDYMYWNMPEGKISVYTSVMGSKYVAEEDIPSMEWEINEDSVMTVMDYECYMAKTRFRGREWTVWYTDAIPVSHGPWKFNGLPGMVLYAKCDGYITISACAISTANISPVKFYNFSDYKYEHIERKKLLEMRSNPRLYPAKTRMTPRMELE